MVNISIGYRDYCVFVFIVNGSLKWEEKGPQVYCDVNVQSPQKVFFPPQRWRKTFPDIIRRGKAIDFLATVGMPADGIAYNHYGIKYVLKRLEDQRRSKGSTHMERERTGRYRETEGEKEKKSRQVAIT